MLRTKDAAGAGVAAKKRAKARRPTTAETFELETDAAARRRQERRKQRDDAAPPQLKAQQKLARVKKTEEHAHLRLRHRQSGDERKRSLHTNGSVVKVGIGEVAPVGIALAQPQTARGAPSEAPTLRTVLERQRPQSAKPSRQSGLVSSSTQKELVAGTRIRVRHWENWLCHPIPTTATQLMASQSSPTLRADKGGHHSKADARPTDTPDAETWTTKKTNIVVDMRRLRVLDASDDDDGDGDDGIVDRRPGAGVRQAWASDPTAGPDEDAVDL